MERNEHVGMVPAGHLEARTQGHELVAVAGHLDPIAPGGEELALQLLGHGQGDILLIGAGRADGPGIGPAMAGIDIDQGQGGGGRGSGPQGRHGAGPEGCRHGFTAAAGQGDNRRGGARLEHGRGAGRGRIGRGPQPGRQLVDRPGAQRRNNRGIVDDREERSLRRRGVATGVWATVGTPAASAPPMTMGGFESIGPLPSAAAKSGPLAGVTSTTRRRDRAPPEPGMRPALVTVTGPFRTAISRSRPESDEKVSPWTRPLPGGIAARQSRRGKLDIDPVRARQQADAIGRGLRQVEDDAGGVGMQPQADLENSLLRPCPAGKQA